MLTAKARSLALPALVVVGIAGFAPRAPGAEPGPFPVFEAAPVHPLEITPDGRRLLAVNLDEHRLVVFDLEPGRPPRPVGEVPVGLAPVTVRARTASEAWVVNHLSDSVSLVDLERMTVVATLRTGDEPTDLVFAPDGSAWICLSGERRLERRSVEDPGTVLQSVPLAGSRPRSLALDPGGTRIHVGFLEGGNGTTVVPVDRVSEGPGLPSPRPAMASGLPDPPAVALIVRWNGAQWIDELGRNWNAQVEAAPVDRDLVTVDALTGGVLGSVGGLGSAVFNLAVHPGTGRVLATGQAALNHVRFEPNLRGRFARSRLSVLDPSAGDVAHFDLNPDTLPGGGGPGSQAPGGSVSLPLDLLPDPSGTRVYVAAFGSGVVAVVDGEGRIVDHIPGGAGPCGLAWDDRGGRLCILDRLGGAVILVEPAGGARFEIPLGFIGTPEEIREGRRIFYDAGMSSPGGDLSCATCHLFGGADGLAWNLGDPTGRLLRMPELFGGGLVHPMKGPMVTQSLKGLRDAEPFHWRGDRFTLADFNGAFVSLLGREAPLPEAAFVGLEAFLLALEPAPNPRRRIDNALPDPASGPNPRRGRRVFQRGDPASSRACTDCHFGENGGAPLIVAAESLERDQDLAVPPLTGMLEKVPFDAEGNRIRGFGFGHDGAFGTLDAFFDARRFTFENPADREDLAAFLMAFGNDPHAGFGAQGTISGPPQGEEAERLDLLRRAADRGELGVTLRGPEDEGDPRGWLYSGGGTWEADREEAGGVPFEVLLATAAPGRPLTYTAVPREWMTRLALDRDGDGFRDGDERAAGSDPGDPASIPDTLRIAGGIPIALGPVFPNPVPGTEAAVSFRLDAAGPVQLTLHDVRGRRVRVLVDERDHPAGFRRVLWDRRDAVGRISPAGVYFLRLAASGGFESRRVVLLP